MPSYLIENAKNNIKTSSECDKENEVFTENNKSS
jgi:hypothetical protein